VERIDFYVASPHESAHFSLRSVQVGNGTAALEDSWSVVVGLSIDVIVVVIQPDLLALHAHLASQFIRAIATVVMSVAPHHVREAHLSVDAQKFTLCTFSHVAVSFIREVTWTTVKFFVTLPHTRDTPAIVTREILLIHAARGRTRVFIGAIQAVGMSVTTVGVRDALLSCDALELFSGTVKSAVLFI